MRTTIYFFIILLCVSILALGFSIQYYRNNLGYHEYVNRYFNESNYEELHIFGITPEERIEHIALDNKNMSYNPILLKIAYFSAFMCLLSIVYLFIHRKELPRYTNEKSDSLFYYLFNNDNYLPKHLNTENKFNLDGGKDETSSGESKQEQKVNEETASNVNSKAEEKA